MKFKIIKPTSTILASSVEYFLFIESSNNNTKNAYTTLPNTNTCLSIYKSNNVDWSKATNKCFISNSSNFGNSRLYGWHQKPFIVSCQVPMDQICIVFSPTGIADFTKIPIHKLDQDSDPFHEIFNSCPEDWKSKLFEDETIEGKTQILEQLLLHHFIPREKNIVDLYIQELSAKWDQPGFKISQFCNLNRVHESTLYRNFISVVGESPKKFKQKLRFRNGIAKIGSTSLTNLAYLLNYSDQSHFIKEVKKYSGKSPKVLALSLKKIQEELLLLN